MFSDLDSFSTFGIPFLELLLLGRSMEFILRGVQEAIRQDASNHCVQWQFSVLQPFFAPSDHRLHLTGDVLSGHDQVRFTLRSELRSAADIGVLPYVFRQLHGHVLEQRFRCALCSALLASATTPAEGLWVPPASASAPSELECGGAEELKRAEEL